MNRDNQHGYMSKKIMSIDLNFVLDKYFLFKYLIKINDDFNDNFSAIRVIL